MDTEGGGGRARVDAFYVPVVPKPNGEESATPHSISAKL